MYGYEVAIDMRGCNPKTFTRQALASYFKGLCDLIKMKRADLHFWDYDSEEEKMAQEPHLAGTSAVQFIETSNITIHALDKLGEVYVNIFSCKEFFTGDAVSFTKEFFEASEVKVREYKRGEWNDS